MLMLPFLKLLPVFRIRIHLIRIRIQHFRLNIDLFQGFDDQILKRNLLLGNFFFLTNYNLPIRRPP
jgi:hypothetical protein